MNKCFDDAIANNPKFEIRNPKLIYGYVYAAGKRGFVADSDFIAAAASGESDCRAGRQSFSGFDADSGADSDFCPENHRDDSGHYDYRRLDDGHAARIRHARLRHDAASQRNALT